MASYTRRSTTPWPPASPDHVADYVVVVLRFARRKRRPAAASTPFPDGGASGLSGFFGFLSVGKILTTANVTPAEIARIAVM